LDHDGQATFFFLDQDGQATIFVIRESSPETDLTCNERSECESRMAIPCHCDEPAKKQFISSLSFYNRSLVIALI
ncbi:MAG: hypothetical protein M0Q94_11970, partial [Candidatus Cloacimonetes bacterium]|nr:hypothetical protein [Candidatus Cloacimonadota bacterium]